jgi:CDP-glycerol glycerophosphotransferase (TagB/SpsB family)
MIARLSSLVPLTDTATIHGTPDLDDQTLALVSGLERRKSWKVVVLLNSRASLRSRLLDREEFRGVRLVPYRSIRGIWALSRSRVRFTTHGSMGGVGPNPNAVTVNVWHGMPVKYIGLDAHAVGVPADVTVATCVEFRDIMAAALDVPVDSVKITGLPRNDRLLDAVSTAPRTRRALGVPDGVPIVLVLPTWRDEDEIQRDATDGLGLIDLDIGELARIAEEARVVIFVKPHPLDRSLRDSSGGGGARVITDRDLADLGLTLYETLAAIDILVTDYSSVWIDYLLTGRPIVFMITDEEHYRVTRGVYFPEFRRWLPGPVVSSPEELKSCILKFSLGLDGYQDARLELAARWHTFADASSTGRLLALEDLGIGDGG